MRLLSLLAAGLFASVLLAAPVPKDKEKVKDEEAIVGSWSIDNFDAAGEKPPPPDQVAAIRFVFADKGVFTMTGGPAERGEGTYKLDPAAKTKTIDITFDGRKMLGLYELDGDTLKLCIPNSPDSPRPEEFKADGKARVAIITFKRVKDEKKGK